MRIVLVEASRTAQKMMTRLLEARGHLVQAFNDGPEAMKHVGANLNIDALITSVELPSLSGLELCWEARLLSTCRRPIYIILMSSNYDRHKLTEALDSGADDFIAKPVAPEELYARLRAAERIAGMQRDLLRLASTDPLTGVFNRRAFFEEAQYLAADAGSGTPLCAAMIDIDHFKQVNDVHGHGTGDDVIRAVARTAKAETEIVGRLGGEEFAILQAGQSLSGMADWAEQLRLKIADLCIKTSTLPLRVTCSIGVSNWRAADTIDDLLKRADIALYQAKRTGRNRVVVADPVLTAAPGEGFTTVIRSGQRREAEPGVSSAA